jgi:outer membrane lipoprotein-sorting protein
MLGSIRGTILNEDKKFRFEYRENNQYYLVKMNPLSQQLKTYITEIRIFFNKNTNYVSRLEIEEASGDYTKIEFTGLKINNDVPDENFSVR